MNKPGGQERAKPEKLLGGESNPIVGNRIWCHWDSIPSGLQCSPEMENNLRGYGSCKPVNVSKLVK